MKTCAAVCNCCKNEMSHGQQATNVHHVKRQANGWLFDYLKIVQYVLTNLYWYVQGAFINYTLAHSVKYF